MDLVNNDGEQPLYTIGDLARITDLSVKTIRFYSDEGLTPPTDRTPGEVHMAVNQLLIAKAGAALAEDVGAESDRAASVITEIVAGWAEAFGSTDSVEYRAEMVDRIATFGDARVVRYWELMGIINGWPARPNDFPAWDWTVRALRAHPIP